MLEKFNFCTRIFLVLVPHRDIRLVLRNFSSALFKAGFSGAYHFPWVAPLAALSRPLDREELKHCARSLRQAAGGEKICAAEASFTTFPPESGTALFGPRLGFQIPQDTGGGKAVYLFPQPVIGAALLDADEIAAFTTAGNADAMPPQPTVPVAVPPAAPKLSFRAAAVANMFWRPMKTKDAAAGYKWKIGPLCWLPPVRKDK
jgi:hypothetical protein